MAEWLRNIPDEELKKMGNAIGIDGVYYTYNGYDKLYNLHKNVCVGDTMLNPYTKVSEKIEKIDKEWFKIGYATNNGYLDAEALEITFITETGYIIYDLND